jgi:hypothetical protein
MCTRAVMPSSKDRCRCFPYAPRRFRLSRGGEAKLQAKILILAQILFSFMHNSLVCGVGRVYMDECILYA